jgi:hypothetical protein
VKRVRLISLILSFTFMVGCATGQIAWSPEKRSQITTRIYSYNYRSVFDQVSVLFEENGYGFEISNKKEGIVRTLPKTSGITGLSSMSTVYDIKITPIDENQTRVRALILSQGSIYVPSGSAFKSGNWAPTGDEMIDEKHYRSFFNGLEKRLENSLPWQ